MNNKFILSLVLLAGLISVVSYSSAQEGSVLTAILNVNSPEAKSIPAGAQYADVARITLTASGEDVYMNGIYLATDLSGGLSNFTDVLVYDTSNNSLIGSIPNQSENPNLLQFSPVRIGLGLSKTYLVRVNLSSLATGNVRVGFGGFTFATEVTPSLVNVPVYGNVMTLPGTVATPTPSPSISPSPTPSPPSSSPSNLITPSSLGFTSLSALNLSEGDTISAAGSSDPDIYIANSWGYKRLFLNPIIFGFYGHLGGFSNVRGIVPSTRDMLVTSGLFRNCEINDDKVYGVEITGEDTGTLHWINTTGEAAVADDPDFFKKVFCINSAEFNWYSQGSAYTSVNQVPTYSR